MSFNIGESVGPYRIIEQLGQGGMATVYKAYHAALDRYVALKVLHPAFNEEQTFTMRFQREARVVAKLEHPHIVPVYDYAEHENRPYLVMKFIEGETLKARFNRGELSTEEINKVVECVGTALSYAHKQGILHRDIKPSNVLIGTDGEMFLADFGLARIAQAGESTLSSDSIMGTPQYISPEQAMGKKDLDEGTDIYSFGVMLYELVVGQVPFNADTPFSIIHDHIYSPLPMPTEINPSVPQTVQRVLLKALSKERRDRYDSVAALVKAFREAWTAAGIPMQGTKITMPPATLRKAAQTAKRVGAAAPSGETVTSRGVEKKRRPTWVYAIGGAFALVCCLAAGLTFSRGGFFGIIPPLVPSRVSTITAAPPTEPATAGVQDASPEITAAKELVSKNPGDPDAHLQLALAYFDANQPRPALEAMAQAADLAGPNNRDFLIKAIDKFRSREAWIACTILYVRVSQTWPVGEVPEEIIQGLGEAVYKAAELPDLPLFLPFTRIDRIDQPLGLVARGRYALFHGNIDDATINMNQAKRLKPTSYEAALLEAEIDLKAGHPELAKNILLSLSSDLGAPEWVRLMADQLLLKSQ